MAESICEAFQSTAKRLMDLGLGYLTLDRSASTLSTGERQRMQLARAVRNRTTGVLYVLDEPSIGLHPSNIVGLTGVMHDLVADGNSVILVDHDTQILKEADWIVEMGPEAGAKGGHVIAAGERSRRSKKTPLRRSGRSSPARLKTKLRELRRKGRAVCKRHDSSVHRFQIHTVKPLEVDIPKGRLTVVTGVSGSGKTTMVLESLDPRAGGEHQLAAHCPRTSAQSKPTASRTSSSSTRRPSASTSAPRSRPTRASTTSCASSMPSLPTQRRTAIRRAIFPTTPARFAAPAATAPALSVSTCSSCRMWTFPARTAVAPATQEPPIAVKLTNKRGRERLASGADGYGRQLRHRILQRTWKTVSQQAGSSEAAGPRLPDARRGNAEPVRRRGTAAQARQRDRPRRRPTLSSSSMSRPSACIRWMCGCCSASFRRFWTTARRSSSSSTTST